MASVMCRLSVAALARTITPVRAPWQRQSQRFVMPFDRCCNMGLTVRNVVLPWTVLVLKKVEMAAATELVNRRNRRNSSGARCPPVTPRSRG
jgi:hypothetical protein